VAGIVARISGCAKQKELSLEDQEDHGKEEVAEMYRGPVEYRVIATKGKGERLDRPELAKVEQMIRSRELDVLVMEDVGRLVRGTAAVTLWGIAVDHGTRCIAPNDCIDTADETWEEELISACRDHVGHNAHTSKRLKKKLMNRFKKYGGAVALLIAGYIKPEDAKTYDDWIKVESATDTIVEGLSLLKATLNCSAVADYLNSEGFPTGPYCRRKEWNGPMVRRYYRNRLLAGNPGRGFRHTIKHNESGRRVSVKNTAGEPYYLEYPHLAHVDAAKLDEVNRLLKLNNASRGRKKVNGRDPLWQKPRKRTLFPGQYARCWYCGHHYVWGANGVTGNLMCSNARHWHCWNSIGFNGELAAKRIVEAITGELYKLGDFDSQFADLVRAAHQHGSSGSADRWQRLRYDEETLARQKANLMSAILELGARPMFEEQLKAFDARENELRQERRYLESLQGCEPRLPQNILELRHLLEQKFAGLAIESPEFATLLQQLVPGFEVYLVRLCDGGHLLPRGRITLNLAGHVADAQYVPGLNDMLRSVITLDLFARPPQRERIREDVVRLAAAGVRQRAIARELKDENPKLPVVQHAIALDRKMRELGLDSPYFMVTKPPDDYPKLRRHKNPKYRFEQLDGYEQPLL
jgi:hypothetical protein